MAVEQSVVEYKGFGKCARLANGTAELLATLDMGPRIIRYGFSGGKNELCEALDKGSETPNGFWPMIGGHRLWHSPEDMPLTYTIDDHPVDYEWLENGLRVTSQVDKHSGLQKELVITMDAQGTGVKVTHNLYNRNPWAAEYSAWALTVMATGGVSIIPQNTEDTGLLPNRYMTIWPYTMFSDPRLELGDKYILFRQDPSDMTKCKIGLANHCGWAAYINDSVMYVKRFKHVQGAAYPDNGCSYETFTCDFMLEMESLSPLVKVKPGECITHDEEWALYAGVEFDGSMERAEKITKQYIK